jgi:molybdopterin molybdotransferase
MIGPDEALQLVLASARPGPPSHVPLDEACGLRLAEAVRADRDYPPFARAMMDGYAVRCEDAGCEVQAVGQVAAGQEASVHVRVGHCVEIMTGAVCPPGAEAVVPIELTHRQRGRVLLPETIAAGEGIAAQGSECRSGSVVASAGERITPLVAAVLATVGAPRVLVLPRPSLAVITTGPELVPLDRQPGPAQIRDSNGPMLVALARGIGLPAPLHLHADDTVEAIVRALGRAEDRTIVVLTGGVSEGQYDLVPKSLERFAAERVFHKVRQKPGKPLLLARKGGQLFFALPGNPLAAHLGFHRYVAAAVRQMMGDPPAPEPTPGTLTAGVRADRQRTRFVLARARRDPADTAGWRVDPLGGATSADLFTPSRANCYVKVPPGERGLEAGESVPFVWIEQGRI